MYLLVADLFLNILVEQLSGETRVFGFLKDEAGGRLYRELVELLRRCPVVQSADSFGRDPEAVDGVQVETAACDRPDDLIDINGFIRAVSLADLHRGLA